MPGCPRSRAASFAGGVSHDAAPEDASGPWRPTLHVAAFPSRAARESRGTVLPLANEHVSRIAPGFFDFRDTCILCVLENDGETP